MFIVIKITKQKKKIQKIAPFYTINKLILPKNKQKTHKKKNKLKTNKKKHIKLPSIANKIIKRDNLTNKIL
jgi:hypothetical protein